MNLERFINVIIIITKVEFLLVFVAIMSLFLVRFFLTLKVKKENKKKEKLRELLLNTLQEQKKFSLDLISKKVDKNYLLSVLEDFEAKFKGPEWINLKANIINHFLIEKAQEWASSTWWIRRNFAARCFVLLTKPQFEKYVLLLLKDPVPLIRMSASICAVKIGTTPLLRTLFEAMSKEPERGRYSYRDAVLSRGQTSTFSWIREQVKIEKDPKMRLLYLDIMAARFDSDVVTYIQHDLHNLDDKIRLRAVKILSSIPNEETANLILPFLTDSYYLIRAEAAKALPALIGDGAINNLEKLLIDDEWWVRLQAALAIKRLGIIGENFLKSKKQEENQRAYEVSQYALSLPEG